MRAVGLVQVHLSVPATHLVAVGDSRLASYYVALATHFLLIAAHLHWLQ